MTETTLSSTNQLVIPKEIGEEAGLKSGRKVVFLVKDGIIKLIPKHPPSTRPRKQKMLKSRPGTNENFILIPHI